MLRHHQRRLWQNGATQAKRRTRRCAIATFVLVHGAWHGGWCWKKVIPLLRERDHEVFAPTLTGLGERAHLRKDSIGLGTHIQDIVNVLDYEDLHDVVLVGHSYGGMVISGAADRVPHRIAHAVYLDAHVPVDGQSVIDILGFTRPGYETDQWLDPISTFGVEDAADLEWLKAKMTPQPTRALREKITLSRPLEENAFTRTYVLAEEQTLGPTFKQTSERLAADPRWRVTSLPTGHDIMVTMPVELTETLFGIVD
jgi:pimeloyl-ACP methyl ester carboxylesterase